MMRKVAVVGMDGVFPTCNGLQEFSDKLFSNQSLIREWPEALKYEKQLRSKVSGFISLDECGLRQVDSSILEDYPEFYEDLQERIPKGFLSTSDLGAIWAMFSTLGALKMANWTTSEIKSERTGVVVGSAGAGHSIMRASWKNFFDLGKKSRALGTHNVDRTMVYRDAANIACLIQSKGVCEAIGSACATGLGNIGYAVRLIAWGDQDRIICGGTEATSIETFIGFDAMQVLSSGFSPAESSRSFDKNRKGFVCSFGCGIVALEAYDLAKARGANILAVIDQYFNNGDGDGDMFAPSYDGQMRLLKGVIGSNKLPDVVKAHGTSTVTGDMVELTSIASFLKGHQFHISAPKSQFGHMLGAAGAVEFIAALLMLKEQKVSPCLNANELSEDLEQTQLSPNWRGPLIPAAQHRELIPTHTITKEINNIVCLNYGFGGTNSAISISKPY